MYILTKKIAFPEVSMANRDGLLAIGGDLSAPRLVHAYSNGIFPWYEEGQPILWWSPDPRFVLFPNNLKISKNTKKLLLKNEFKVTINKAFTKVIEQCATVERKGNQVLG